MQWNPRIAPPSRSDAHLASGRTYEHGWVRIMRELPQPSRPAGYPEATMAGFLGRAEELAAIRESCARARRDSAPTAIVLEGDPGVGKSRLLAEALRRVPIDARATVAGYEPEREVPFALGQSILRALADSSARARDWLAPALAPASPSAPRDWTGVFEAAHR